MFYLGGLTLGYLSPYPVSPEAVAPAPVKAKKAKPVFETTGNGTHKDDEERPILWPWHVFY